MLDLRNIKTISIIGGGTAGWFAALTIRKLFAKNIVVQVIESPKIGIVGVGEGRLINLVHALNHLNIPTSEFMKEAGAAFKWGFCYEGWNTGQRNDEFYHLFPNPSVSPFAMNLNGYHPQVSALIAKKIPLCNATIAFKAIQKRATQQETAQILTGGQAGISSSIHFDSHKAAGYLAKVAVERGVQHIQTKV